MLIKDIINETTSSGGIATVVAPMTKKSVIKRPRPVTKIKMGNGIYEGEERSIIQHNCIEKLVNEFGGREHTFANKEDLEYAIYNELASLDVADCVDPDEYVGGQRIGDFAGGRVIDVISSGDVLDDVMQNLDLSQLEEGKSPHKKGTKKYKKHMAAMHAG